MIIILSLCHCVLFEFFFLQRAFITLVIRKMTMHSHCRKMGKIQRSVRKKNNNHPIPKTWLKMLITSKVKKKMLITSLASLLPIISVCVYIMGSYIILQCLQVRDSFSFLLLLLTYYKHLTILRTLLQHYLNGYIVDHVYNTIYLTIILCFSTFL